MVVLKPDVKTLSFLVACVALLAVWSTQKAATAELRAQVSSQRDDRRAMESLRREQERLRARQRAIDQQAEREAAAAHAPPDRLMAGKWLPPAAWKNQGSATPVCTVESMLWAAAGGEVAALGNILHFDAAARAKIDEIFARLPADFRTRYVSPAQFVAAFTIAAIPVGNAKLVWQVQDAPDEAEACVWITQPDFRPLDSSTASPQSNFDDLAGPTWRPGQKNIANFSLRRVDGVWRLVVPLSAVLKIENALGGVRSK